MRAAVLLALGLLAAPALPRAEEVPRAETVIFDLDRRIEAPALFNPFAEGALRLQGAHQAMWEPLFVVDWSTGALQPWLATGIEADDAGTTLTLRLREGVTWSDGAPFGADDVVLSLDLAMRSDSGALARMRDAVLSVERAGDLSVAIRLAAPDPRFALNALTVRVFGGPVMLPAHVWADQDPETFAFDPPIGTGPYLFAGASDEMAVWDRDPDWWGARTGFRPLPAPRRLIWLHSGREDLRAERLASGALDAGHAVSAATFEAIRAVTPTVMAWRDRPPWGAPDLCPLQLEFNTAAPPWDDPTLRRAVADALDRGALARATGTIPSDTMFADLPPLSAFADAVRTARLALPAEARPARAAEAMRRAGWARGPDGAWRKDGAPLRAAILADAGAAADVALADRVAEQLSAFGIETAVEGAGEGTFWSERLALGRFGMAITMLSCGSVADPHASMARYLPGDAQGGWPARGTDNLARWSGPDAEAYAALVARIGATPPGDPALPALTAAAYSRLDRGMPFVPLVQTLRIVPFSTAWWTGWPDAADPYGHPFFWWGDTHRILHALRPADRSPFLGDATAEPPAIGFLPLSGPRLPAVRPEPRILREVAEDPMPRLRPADPSRRGGGTPVPRSSPFLPAPRGRAGSSAP